MNYKYLFSLLIQVGFLNLTFCQDTWSKDEKNLIYENGLKLISKYTGINSEQKEIIALCYMNKIINSSNKTEYFSKIDVEVKIDAENKLIECAKGIGINLVEIKKNTSQITPAVKHKDFIESSNVIIVVKSDSSFILPKPSKIYKPINLQIGVQIKPWWNGVINLAHFRISNNIGTMVGFGIGRNTTIPGITLNETNVYFGLPIYLNKLLKLNYNKGSIFISPNFFVYKGKLIKSNITIPDPIRSANSGFVIGINGTYKISKRIGILLEVLTNLRLGLGAFRLSSVLYLWN